MQTYRRTPQVRAGLLAPLLAIAIPFAALVAALSSCASAPNAEHDALPTLATDIPVDYKPEVIAAISAHYFADPDVDATLPVQDIVKRLDPFSRYFTKAAYDRFVLEIEDQDFRYGFTYQPVGGKLIITHVLQGSPAEEAGMQPGDVIESLSRQLVFGSEERFRQLMHRSEKICEFGIRRAHQKKTVRVWMERGNVTEPSVPVALMLDSATGFIAIDGFHKGTSDRLARALDQVSKCGARSVVLDLRGNSGGLVVEAMQCANLFVHTDTPVLTLRSRQKLENEHYALRDEARYSQMPLVLLVDDASASATEIFAGILQDLSRAKILGQPTCGKGLVMRFFDLPNDDRLYLATAEYYLPSGRCVQRPYFHDTLCANYSCLETQVNLDHALDAQLTTNDCDGYDRPAGPALYGGQGIIPDLIIGGSDYPEWLQGSIYTAIAPYLHEHADELLSQRAFTFDELWNAPDSLTEVALASARQADTTIGKMTTARLAWEIPHFIKWYIAYCVWGNVGTFAVHTRHATIVRRGLTMLHDGVTVAGRPVANR